VIRFQAPAVGRETAPEVMSVPGCRLLLEYRPATRVPARLWESTYTRSEATDPDACGVKGNASADPATFASTPASTALSPSSLVGTVAAADAVA
jgi:hypothetical protein